MNRIFLLSIILCNSLVSRAQLLTEPLKSAKDTLNGIVYTLPKTVFDIEIQTKITEETPGIYYQYAERFLGIKNLILTGSIKHEVLGFTVRTKVVADTAQNYLISVGKKSKDVCIELTPEGFLKSINGSTAPSIVNNPSNSAIVEKSTLKKAWETDESSIIVRDMQLSGSTAKMAELAANQLFSIREARLNILKQDVENTPADGRSYELVLSELNRIEKSYLELFIGKKVESYKSTRFIQIPEKDSTEILCRFSSLRGVLDKNDLGGDPIFIKFKKLPTPTDSLRVYNSGIPMGIYYRMPSQVLFQISDGSTKMFSEVFTVNQFGKVMSLPASQIKTLKLSPITGGILKLSK